MASEPQTYYVSFAVINTEKEFAPRVTRVAIHEGYSVFEDLRQIIALPLGLKAENIQIRSMILEDYAQSVMAGNAAYAQ